jgi:hypothetical protein
MVLEDNDIIQVDATVIVRVLIFLTLSNIFRPSKFEELTKISITSAAIIPFAGSAIAIPVKSIIILRGLGNFLYMN